MLADTVAPRIPLMSPRSLAYWFEIYSVISDG